MSVVTSNSANGCGSVFSSIGVGSREYINLDDYAGMLGISKSGLRSNYMITHPLSDPPISPTLSGDYRRNDSVSKMLYRSDTFTGYLNALSYQQLDHTGMHTSQDADDFVVTENRGVTSRSTNIEGKSVERFINEVLNSDFTPAVEFSNLIVFLNKKIIGFILSNIVFKDNKELFGKMHNPNYRLHITKAIAIAEDFIQKVLFDALSGVMCDYTGKVSELCYPVLLEKLRSAQDDATISYIKKQMINGYLCRMMNLMISRYYTLSLGKVGELQTTGSITLSRPLMKGMFKPLYTIFNHGVTVTSLSSYASSVFKHLMTNKASGSFGPWINSNPNSGAFVSLYKDVKQVILGINKDTGRVDGVKTGVVVGFIRSGFCDDRTESLPSYLNTYYDSSGNLVSNFINFDNYIQEAVAMMHASGSICHEYALGNMETARKFFACVVHINTYAILVVNRGPVTLSFVRMGARLSNFIVKPSGVSSHRTVSKGQRQRRTMNFHSQTSITVSLLEKLNEYSIPQNVRSLFAKSSNKGKALPVDLAALFCHLSYMILSSGSKRENVENIHKHVTSEAPGWIVSDLSNNNMSVFINNSDKKVVIAHRGTDTSFVATKNDTRADLALLIGVERFDPKFQMRLKITNDIVSEIPTDYGVYLTGHSLGGATVIYSLATDEKLRSRVSFSRTFNAGASPLYNTLKKIEGTGKNVIHHRMSNDVISAGLFVNSPIGTVSTKFQLLQNPYSAHKLDNWMTNT